ncbi:MAG: hypothetical protein OEM81_08620 [Acidimicrobiia bacterium]|nr:hypothetical protein [Acidimicrobiia bacterium]MDH3397876.1 hypothetical protein [Acidimicrobiia bacterium]
MVDLKGRCRHAVDRGKQLWAIADHIEYRLALEAPGEWAGPMVFEGAGRFTLGPLPEVTASRHTWAELSPHLPEGPARTVTAYERVVRREDLRQAEGIDPLMVELPLILMEWEPAYAVATYHSDKAEFPAPDLPRMQEVVLPKISPPPVDEPESSDALLSLTRPWTEESNGRAEAAIVHGDALGSIRSLGPSRARIAPILPELAMALMAWTGASGGAHGRRPGAAAGRYGAWWAAATLSGLIDEWPVPPDHLGEAINELKWYVWSDLISPTGWTLHLAVEDPPHGLAFAVAAVDAM